MKAPFPCLILTAWLTGCASGRFLSEKEDADMRKSCEAVGCTVVPNPVMEQLLQRLQGTRT